MSLEWFVVCWLSRKFELRLYKGFGMLVLTQALQTHRLINGFVSSAFLFGYNLNAMRTCVRECVRE